MEEVDLKLLEKILELTERDDMLWRYDIKEDGYASSFENFKFLQRNFQYLPQLFIDGFAFSLDGNKLVIAITKNIARQNYKKKLSGKSKIYEFFGLGNYII